MTPAATGRDNAAVADLLREMAALLQVQGEDNTFRVAEPSEARPEGLHGMPGTLTMNVDEQALVVDPCELTKLQAYVHERMNESAVFELLDPRDGRIRIRGADFLRAASACSPPGPSGAGSTVAVMTVATTSLTVSSG